MYFSADCACFYVGLNETPWWTKLVYDVQEGAMWKFGTCLKGGQAAVSS